MTLWMLKGRLGSMFVSTICQFTTHLFLKKHKHIKWKITYTTSLFSHNQRKVAILYCKNSHASFPIFSLTSIIILLTARQLGVKNSLNQNRQKILDHINSSHDSWLLDFENTLRAMLFLYLTDTRHPNTPPPPSALIGLCAIQTFIADQSDSAQLVFFPQLNGGTWWRFQARQTVKCTAYCACLTIGEACCLFLWLWLAAGEISNSGLEWISYGLTLIVIFGITVVSKKVPWSIFFFFFASTNWLIS